MEKSNYLDFHTHILPGIDDGASDWDMTRKMLEEEYRQGVKTVMATPHNYSGKKKQDNGQVLELCQEADRIAKEINAEMQVMPGNEIQFRWEILEEIEQGHILAMGGSSYLLIEFLPGEQYGKIYQGVKDLISAGYYPVIAHVERVISIFYKQKYLEELIKMGCYFQVNTETFMGGPFDRDVSLLKKYVRYGYIHFLGSDCHNLEDRKPLMEECVTKISKKLKADELERLLYHNPSRFLSKKYV